MLGPLAARGVLGPLACGSVGGAASPLLTGLVSYWRMDEESGTRVDIVGGHNFTVNGSIGYAAGKIGNAVDITKSDAQWMAQNYNFMPVEASFTWAQWQYLGGTAGPMLLVLGPVEKPSTSGLIAYFDSISGGRLLYLVYDSVSGSSGAYQTGIGLADAWRFFVFGYDASVRKAFSSINGAPKFYSATALANGLKTNCGWANIGYASGYRPSRADEMGFWGGVVFSDEDIALLYNAGAGRTWPF